VEATLMISQIDDPELEALEEQLQIDSAPDTGPAASAPVAATENSSIRSVSSRPADAGSDSEEEDD
jgi:hypothetical protein